MSIFLSLIIIFFLFTVSNLKTEANNLTVVINNGHSVGYESGAVGEKTTEAELNEALAEKLVLELDKRGYKVYITHSSKESMKPFKLISNEDGSWLKNVGAAINSVNPDLSLAIHHNAGGATASGTELYWSSYRDYDQNDVYTVSGLWSEGTEARRDKTPTVEAQQSETFAQIVKERFDNFPNLPFRKIVERDDYVPAHSKCPSILYEGGYISNPDEEKYLMSETYQNESAKRLADSIDIFFEKQGIPILKTQVYRVYNPKDGEHLYTTSSLEVSTLVKSGWKDEGIGWQAPENGEAVYRLFNPVLGNHLYTKDKNEVNVLLSTAGWVADFDGNPIFYSGGDVPIYRVYNEKLNGMHHLTTDENEYRVLPQYGWKQEGVSIYAYSK